MINFIIKDNQIRFYDKRKRKEIGIIRPNGIVSFSEDNAIFEILQMNQDNNLKLALIKAVELYDKTILESFKNEMGQTFESLQNDMNKSLDNTFINIVNNKKININNLALLNLQSEESVDVQKIYASLNYEDKKTVIYSIYGTMEARKLLTKTANTLAQQKMPQLKLNTIATFSKFFGYSL